MARGLERAPGDNTSKFPPDEQTKQGKRAVVLEELGYSPPPSPDEISQEVNRLTQMSIENTVYLSGELLNAILSDPQKTQRTKELGLLPSDSST